MLLELLRQGSYSARDLSAAVGIPERQVDFHLEHIRRSLQREQESLEVLPPRCHGCGFVFAKRTRLTRPGRCPICRGESIQEPLFTVRGAAGGKGRPDR